MEEVLTIPSPGAVLVVDDNPLITSVVRALLGAEGYAVAVCDNGRSALEYLRSRPVDVVVCDVMMPEMDGYQLQQSIRDQQDLAHVPFVFLTALDDHEEVSRGHESGADEYLVKPFDPQQLISVVKGKVARSQYLKKTGEQRFEHFRKKVIHTLSHEFRTPLVAITTGTELLIDQQEKLDEKKIVHLLEAIRRGGKRLERLVNDFMIMQQIEAGIATKMVATRAAKHTVHDIVSHAIMQEDLLKDIKEPLEIVHNAGDAIVVIFESHIHDVLGRLISNAIKFSPDKKAISIVSYLLDDRVAIEVRDRGIGIDLGKIQEAMNLFGQVDRDKYEQQGGGLGLAIAQRLAAINGGSLEFEPRDGGGTVATLVLPVWRKS
jgi:two-component system sensor histidine kinase/response regulator